MKIKNWERFQHFKHRNPPWIKLYTKLLNDLEWHQLNPQAAKVLVGLWMLAADHDYKKGILPCMQQIAFRLRMDEKSLESIISGHLSHWIYQDDIKVISHEHQDGCSETETETETEENILSGNLPNGAYEDTHSLWKEAETLLNFLNDRTGKHFKAHNPSGEHTSALKLIHALLKKKYSTVQIRQVIANRWLKWGNDPKMQEYLRPATLFCVSNFENYLGELGAAK